MRGIWLVLLCVLALGACAPRVQTLGPAAATGFIQPYLTEDAFYPRDGQRLGLEHWQATAPRAVIIALHGMNDYAHAFEMPATWWAERGITTYAIDQRGHGRSPQRGIWPGTDLMQNDLEDLVHAARAEHPDLPIYLLGHSMGGGVVMSTLAERHLEVDGAILAAPAVWGWSTLQFPLNTILWVSAHTMPGMIVTGESLNRWPTDNIDVLREMAHDENMIFETRIDAVYGVVSLMDRAYRGAGQVPPPVLLLYGEHDEIIPPRPVADVVEAMCPSRRVAIYENGWHLILRDLEAETVWEDIRVFVEDPAVALPSGAELRGSEQHPCR